MSNELNKKSSAFYRMIGNQEQSYKQAKKSYSQLQQPFLPAEQYRRENLKYVEFILTADYPLEKLILLKKESQS